MVARLLRPGNGTVLSFTHLSCACTAANRPQLCASQGGRVYDSKHGVTCHWCVVA